MSDLGVEQFVADHELLWSMLSSGLLWGAGDCIAQRIEQYLSRSKQQQLHAQPASSAGWDAVRTGRIFIFASCCWAPATYYWFQLLELAVPGEGLEVAVKRMLIDQSLYAPAVIAALFVVVAALSGLSFHATLRRLREGYLQTLLSNWMLWPLAQLLLQSGLIPRQQRITVANCINLPWTAYLAYRGHTHT
jgi:hypothetical protein